jgi:hypothetical protein
VLTVDGVLDATTYLPMREAIVKAALDEPRIVIIDISWLTVREDPAVKIRHGLYSPAPVGRSPSGPVCRSV